MMLMKHLEKLPTDFLTKTVAQQQQRIEAEPKKMAHHLPILNKAERTQAGHDDPSEKTYQGHPCSAPILSPHDEWTEPAIIAILIQQTKVKLGQDVYYKNTTIALC